jgi:hypothetical protein
MKPQAQQKRPEQSLIGASFLRWRRDPESNRARRICNPLHNRFAIAPQGNQQPTGPKPTDKKGKRWLPFLNLERDKRLELSTYTLARYRSTN